MASYWYKEVMPNGESKNWVRLCGAIKESRGRYGSWPTRIRLYPDLINDLRSILSEEEFAKVENKIHLIADDLPFVAGDGEGRSYRHGEEGSHTKEPDISPAEWLGVFPDTED